ncbi:MAG: protein kinase [Planctomycetes bacterium]|nr:protein kinase [Planctomycetota bacterium]
MTSSPREPAPADPEKSTPEDDLQTLQHGDESPLQRSTLTNSVMIGSYRLLQKIGEGGMGEVWMAEQKEPVRRRVALKLIRGNAMGSREIMARFDAERQALALMNHPNITRFFDAGTTRDGNPYFVMELVSGKALTRYCDHHKLSIEDRLRLFRDVCSAVQHAHQKGIIHRDLKPSNILVSEVDDKPVVKVIDFGLAKALESASRLTDQSLYTGIGQILGTLKYMSPEQASLDLVDIDTRTDIYSLGVILYELLTGSTPIDDDTIRKRAMIKTLEVIREQESPRPSSKLSNSKADVLQAVSEQRGIDTGKLSRILARDLDWVVMKAIEKERSRRYESASGLGADIERFLAGEPILARPPSLTYRCRKFLRKHLVGAIVTTLLTLLIGAVSFGALMQALRAGAVKQKAIAEEQKAIAEEQRKIAEEQRKIAEEKTQEALANLNEAKKQSMIAKTNEEKAVANFEEAEKQRMIAKTNEEKAVANFEEAEKQRGIADMIGKQADQTRLAFERLAAAMLPAQDDWPMIVPAELVTKLELVGSCRMDLQQFLAAEELFSKALEIRQREMPEAWETFQSRSLLGEALFRQDKFGDAEQHLVAGYEGLVNRQDKIPPTAVSPIGGALERLIALYERLEQPVEVERYRALLGEK